MKIYFCLYLSLLFSTNMHSETFIREYNYVSNPQLDNESTARIIALERVKADLLQEVGIFIKVTESRSQREFNDKYYDEYERNTESITCGIAKTVVMEEKWNGTIFYIKAKIEIDVADYQNKLKAVMENSDLKAALLESKQSVNKALAELEELKRELIVNKKYTQTMSNQYNIKARHVISENYLQKSVNYYLDNDSVSTVKYAQKSIEYNPSNVRAQNVLLYKYGSGYRAPGLGYRNNTSTTRPQSGFRKNTSTTRSGSGRR